MDGALKAKKGEPRPLVVRVIEPAQQIAPTSYLGRALKQIGKHTKKQSSSESDSSSVTETSSDDSDGESDPSNSLSSSSLSEMTTSSDESSEKGHRNRQHGHKLSSKKKHGKKSRCMKHSKRTSGYGKLKPIPPLTYDGVVNSCAFHRFVTEGTAFVESGGVKPKEQVFILSHYLSGKAHEFYVREVAGNPYKWRP